MTTEQFSKLKQNQADAQAAFEKPEQLVRRAESALGIINALTSGNFTEFKIEIRESNGMVHQIWESPSGSYGQPKTRLFEKVFPAMIEYRASLSKEYDAL